MAFKMMYLAIYPMAILARVRVEVGSGESELRVKSGELRVIEPIGWLLAAVLLVVAVRPALAAPRSIRWSTSISMLRANGCARTAVRHVRITSWPMPRRRIGCTLRCSAMRDRASDARARPLRPAGRGGRRGSSAMDELYAIADLRLVPTRSAVASR